jgi:V/A-type H+-transporting ATPase subunit K
MTKYNACRIFPNKKVSKSALNLLILVFLIITTIVPAVQAQASSPNDEPSLGYGLAILGAGLVLGLTGLGVGLGMGTLGAAGAGAVAEKPEVFSKVILMIVFVEAIAIYALTLGFMILMKLP